MREAMKPIARLGAVLAVAGAIAGCGGGPPGPELVGDNAVFLYLPATRLELPEGSQKWFGIGIGGGSGSAFRLTEDQLNEEPRLDATARESYGQFAGRLDLQPHRRVGASVHVAGGETGDHSNLYTGQLKWNAVYPQGPAGLSLSVTAAYGEGSQDFVVQYRCNGVMSCTEDSAQTHVDRRLRDAALILGYQTSRWWQLYGGPFYRQIDFGLEHHANRGEAADVSSGLKGRAQLAGVNFGGALRLYNWMRLLLEGSIAHVNVGGRDDTYLHFAIGQQFYFGPKLAPPALEDRR